MANIGLEDYLNKRGITDKVIENNKISNLINNLPIEIKKQKQFFDLFKTILNRKL